MGEGARLGIQELHRFPNDPVRIHERLHWDILRLLHELKAGMLAARRRGYDDLRSVGIDSWAVDFGLLGKGGELLGNPYHYRDPHTAGVMEEVWRVVPRAELFARTGIQMLPFNTLYQLYALKRAGSPALDSARTLLLIPELLRYFLTGERHSERTNASTTQCFSPFAGAWDGELLDRLGLPGDIFVPAVAPGTPVGTLLRSVGEETGVPALPVIAVGEHDTASAVAAVPAAGGDFAYLSCGTWSLLGTETREPVIGERALAANVTNEIGVGGVFRLLKNVTGLWLLQECRRVWAREGRSRSHEEELALAAGAAPFRSLLDPDAPQFLNPADMPDQIRRYCRGTGQPVPDTDGAIVRCILESLALKYRLTLELIEGLVGRRFPGLHIVGGGIQNAPLCQWTANALERPVWAGPREATAIGNLLVQYLALGAVGDLGAARSLVRDSFPITTYQPAAAEAAGWERAYAAFRRIIET
jgi:rhamnulokinase